MNLLTEFRKTRHFGKSIIKWNAWQSERYFQTSQKSLKQTLTKTMRIKHEDHYKRIDGVPIEYEMIYKLPLHYTINFGKAAFIGSLVVGSASWFYNQYITNIGYSEAHFISSLAADKGDFWYFVAALVGTGLFVYRCCHISTLRLYRNEKQYIAIVASPLPRYNHQFHFKKGDVKEHFNAISLFSGITYKVQNRSMIFSPARFRRPSDLFEMLHDSDSAKYKQIK